MTPSTKKELEKWGEMLFKETKGCEDESQFMQLFMKFAKVIHNLGFIEGSHEALNHPERACRAKCQ